MSAKPKKGLGRGFDSLIPSDLFDESFDPTAKQDSSLSDYRQLAISSVVADVNQPRRHFDDLALEELATSVKQHGVLQPIVVTKTGDKYTIVAGERRWRAAKLAGLDRIPAIVRTLSSQHILEISLIENLQRRDLTPIEIATAYQKLRDQFNLTLDQIGERVGGKSTSAISNTLRLLRLPDVVKRALVEGELSEGQARPLVGMDEATVEALLEKIISEGWSSRRIEQFVVAQKHGDAKQTKVAATLPFEDYRNSFSQRLSTPVKISSNAKGSGTLVISFKNEKDLQRIQDLLK